MDKKVLIVDPLDEAILDVCTGSKVTLQCLKQN